MDRPPCTEQPVFGGERPVGQADLLLNAEGLSLAPGEYARHGDLLADPDLAAEADPLLQAHRPDPFGGEDLLIDPGAVRVRLLRTAPPDTAVPQQHRVQPLLHPLAVIDQVRAGPHQVPHRLPGRGRHPDRVQQPRPVRQRQPRRVPQVNGSVLTRSELPLGISDGATTSQATPIEVSGRCSS
jgi:hypothetical protein